MSVGITTPAPSTVPGGDDTTTPSAQLFPVTFILLVHLLRKETTRVCDSIDRRRQRRAGGVSISPKRCPIRHSSLTQSSRRYYKTRKVKINKAPKVNHNNRGVVCKSAVLEWFRGIMNTDAGVFSPPRLLFLATLF